jgi:hypothetical protein
VNLLRAVFLDPAEQNLRAASRSAELLGILGSLAASPSQSPVENPETEGKT